jgi:hypothetical protein
MNLADDTVRARSEHVTELTDDDVEAVWREREALNVALPPGDLERGDTRILSGNVEQLRCEIETTGDIRCRLPRNRFVCSGGNYRVCGR